MKDQKPALKEIIKKYTDQLPEKIELIEMNLQQLMAQTWQEQTWHDLYILLHNLMGSSGTYGYMELSQLLRQLEVMVKKSLIQAPSEQDQQQMLSLMQEIKAAVENIVPHE